MSEILYDVDAGVATITLNAPERRNAFTAGMVPEFIAACEAADHDDTVGAVLIAAVGESFCSGAHRDILREAGGDPTRDDNFKLLNLTYSAFMRVGALRAPTIAVVCGHAVGAGVNLMLATDLRVVAETARIMTGFLRIGIHPGGGHFALLGRLAGREVAAGLSLFGQEVDGRRAVELGLAWQALPMAEVEPRARELAQYAGRDPELAWAAARSMRLELGPPSISWPAALEAERAAQMWSLRRKKW
jgi:enoyl-CoA hydratase